MRNAVIVGDILDCAARLVPGSMQAICTSPPYFGLRDYGVPATAWPAVEYAPMPGLPPVTVPAETVCLGAERDPLAFVGHLVHVFRCLRPALREDGTLWLNLGDSYTGPRGGTPGVNGVIGRGPKDCRASQEMDGERAAYGLGPKNLLGIPWRAAFALQADGWILRSEVIWHKVAPMPESVTDRPTKAHEQVFLFSLSPRYFYDAEAIREPHQDKNVVDGRYTNGKAVNGAEWEPREKDGLSRKSFRVTDREYNPAGRNRRTVWSPPPAQFAGAHFSTWPPGLVRPMVRAGSSDYGACGACGAPWRRVVELEKGEEQAQYRPKHLQSAKSTLSMSGGSSGWQTNGSRLTVLRWEPGCACPDAGVVPCLILDPFSGSGTTLAVAQQEGRAWLGIDADERAVAWTNERLAGLPVGRLPGC